VLGAIEVCFGELDKTHFLKTFLNVMMNYPVTQSISIPANIIVLVQDKANGRVQTVVDNRAALTAQRLAGGNKDSLAAMSQLLGGGKKS
jgi:hypothetical protein